MKKSQNIVAAFFKDKQGNVVIFQPPNAPLIIWLVLTVVTYFVPKGKFNDVAQAAASASLLVWALLEIINGFSWFRRALGLAVAVSLLFMIFSTYIAMV